MGQDLMQAISGRRSLAAGNRDREPGYMEAVQDTMGRSQDHEDAMAATPLHGYVVIIGEHAGGGSADRIQNPVRLLRVYALLQATLEQLRGAALPPEGMPGLQRQFQVIRREIERAVSPSLAVELRQILPPHEAAPSAGAVRIECAGLASWVESLVAQMLTVLTAAQERSQRISTRDGQD
jgi:proteasome activator-like protein